MFNLVFCQLVKHKLTSFFLWLSHQATSLLSHHRRYEVDSQQHTPQNAPFRLILSDWSYGLSNEPLWFGGILPQVLTDMI